MIYRVMMGDVLDHAQMSDAYDYLILQYCT